MKAFLKNSRHAPRKMKVVADLIKGKMVYSALDILSVTPKRAAVSLEKLLKSAVANAKNAGKFTDNLYIKDCRVDGGMTMKRFMPGARGSAFPIHKHTSHVEIVLDIKKETKKVARNTKQDKSEKLKTKN